MWDSLGWNLERDCFESQFHFVDFVNVLKSLKLGTRIRDPMLDKE